MNTKKIVINDRDFRLMRFIDKYRVASVKSISLACGFNFIHYTRERMKKLVEYGYITPKSIYYGYSPFYSLTATGLRAIEVRAKVYKPSPTTALHYMGVGDIAAYLAHLYQADAIADMYCDKDFRHNATVVQRYQLDTSHKPDLIFKSGKQTYFVEYERSRKGKKKTMENILMNHLSGAHQIWVLGDISFADIKQECDETPHYQGDITFMDYKDIVRELKQLGGVKDEK